VQGSGGTKVLIEVILSPRNDATVLLSTKPNNKTTVFVCQIQAEVFRKVGLTPSRSSYIMQLGLVRTVELVRIFGEKPAFPCVMIIAMSDLEKEAYVESLFSIVAPKYDIINTVLSLTRHRTWRRFAVSKSGLQPGENALDVCCGTGDFAMELARVVGADGMVVGIDFSMPMVRLAEEKANRCGCKWVSFLEANASRLPFADDSFECVTVGFGLRNVANISEVVSEMVRVTRPGGKVISLEASRITSPFLVLPWRFYFYTLAPWVAKLLGGRLEAYKYLPRSVSEFDSRSAIALEFERCGLCEIEIYDLMFGAVCVHVGTKCDNDSQVPSSL
jgi:demethylmenaquinone methyltransferase/2-methoxy-6-polyprenyl-1,4-benzoquinol methylase